MDAIRLLQDLVRIPSVNSNYGVGALEHRGEQRIAQYLTGLLSGNGFDARLQEVSPGRPNVVAFRDGEGERAVGFCAHLDTVPAEDMGESAFAGALRDGRVWGRGACDTKASIAAMIAAAVEEDSPAALPVLLVFTCDEENGMTGVRHFLAHNDVDLAGIIVGEPTGGKLVTAHKGVYRTTVRTEGAAAHSAMPHLGVNAIYRMAAVIHRLQALAVKLQSRPADPLLGTATLNVGTIRGGTAVNSVPDSCVIELDRRLLPEEDPESLTAELLDALAGCQGVVVGSPTLSAPGYTIDRSHPWVRQVAEALGGPELAALPYATDGAFCHQAGVPTVIYGPGESRFAHTRNEHIAVEDVERAVQQYRAILRGAGR